MTAISLIKVKETAPALVSLYKTAGASLARHGLHDLRAAVYLVIDYSGSMKPYYADGSVQALADRVLGLSAHLDDDGRVPVVFFSTDVDAVTDITLTDHRGAVERIASGLGHMGKTSYHLAMDAVIDHYLDSGAKDPALVVFQTDGGPINKLAAERYLCKASSLPLFWQFIGFGNPPQQTVRLPPQTRRTTRTRQTDRRQRRLLPRRHPPHTPLRHRPVRPPRQRIPPLAHRRPRPRHHPTALTPQTLTCRTPAPSGTTHTAPAPAPRTGTPIR
ncbi:hypothetical protein GCM10020256_58600 [Streptomyces thermocoprophilus]